MARIDALFNMMNEQGASDLHLSTGNPPIFRQRGEMVRLNFKTLGHDELKAILFEILSEKQKAHFEETKDLDFAYEVPGLARFRGNIMMQYRGIAAVFRIIPSKILSADELGLPEGVRRMTNFKKGMVLVTGPTGSGKSTTLAGMIDLINSTRKEHILTFEDPLEFIHENKMSLMNQRQIGEHTESFSSALRAALREDPDVILVGEMRPDNHSARHERCRDRASGLWHPAHQHSGQDGRPYHRRFSHRSAGAGSRHVVRILEGGDLPAASENSRR